jgi:hypothetical protein
MRVPDDVPMAARPHPAIHRRFLETPTLAIYGRDCIRRQAGWRDPDLKEDWCGRAGISQRASHRTPEK